MSDDEQHLEILDRLDAMSKRLDKIEGAAAGIATDAKWVRHYSLVFIERILTAIGAVVAGWIAWTLLFSRMF